MAAIYIALFHFLQGTVAVLSENSYAQYYGKFRSNAPKIKVSIYIHRCAHVYRYYVVSFLNFVAGSNERDRAESKYST